MPRVLKTHWWLLRHGPVINPDNLIYGRMDLNIDTQDQGLYGALAQCLPWDSIFLTSQRNRTLATLETVAAAANLPRPAYQARAEFNEQDFGDWEGQTWEALYRQGRSQRFWRDPAQQRPPGGESFADVLARVTQGLGQQTAEHAGQNLVLVAHGGSIRAALAQALGLSAAAALRFSIDYGTITKLTHFALGDGTETWQVECVNACPRHPKSDPKSGKEESCV